MHLHHRRLEERRPALLNGAASCRRERVALDVREYVRVTRLHSGVRPGTISGVHRWAESIVVTPSLVKKLRSSSKRKSPPGPWKTSRYGRAFWAESRIGIASRNDGAASTGSSRHHLGDAATSRCTPQRWHRRATSRRSPSGHRPRIRRPHTSILPIRTRSDET
jgi:hypothetical protein